MGKRTQNKKMKANIIAKGTTTRTELEKVLQTTTIECRRKLQAIQDAESGTIQYVYDSKPANFNQLSVSEIEKQLETWETVYRNPDGLDVRIKGRPDQSGNRGLTHNSAHEEEKAGGPRLSTATVTKHLGNKLDTIMRLADGRSNKQPIRMWCTVTHPDLLFNRYGAIIQKKDFEKLAIRHGERQVPFKGKHVKVEHYSMQEIAYAVLLVFLPETPDDVKLELFYPRPGTPTFEAEGEELIVVFEIPETELGFKVNEYIMIEIMWGLHHEFSKINKETPTMQIELRDPQTDHHWMTQTYKMEIFERKDETFPVVSLMKEQENAEDNKVTMETYRHMPMGNDRIALFNLPSEKTLWEMDYGEEVYKAAADRIIALGEKNDTPPWETEIKLKKLRSSVDEALENCRRGEEDQAKPDVEKGEMDQSRTKREKPVKKAARDPEMRYCKATTPLNTTIFPSNLAARAESLGIEKVKTTKRR
jgi:hypothetical protein